MSQPAVNATTATSALLNWNAPNDANGMIVNYVVNLVAIAQATGSSSSEGSRSGGGTRRKRETSGFMAVNIACIVGGGSGVDRNFTVDPSTTSLTVNDLSESL